MAVSGAADGVLRHIALGREAAGHAVHLLARCGGVKQQAVQRPYLLLIHRHIADDGLVVKHAQQIAAHVGSLGHGAVHGVRHGPGHRHTFQLIGGKIHLVQVSTAYHRQIPGQGAEGDLGQRGIHEAHDGAGRSQRGMAAQVDLAAGREPPQVILLSLLHGKGRLGEVVLNGNGHHLLLVQPFVHHTNSGRGACKHMVGKGIDHILSHRGFLLICKVISSGKEAQTAI